MDIQRTVNILRGTGEKKPRSDDRPDIPVTISENELTASLGPHALRRLRRLQQCGHTITGLRAGAVLFCELLKARERVIQGVTLVICGKVLEQYWAYVGKKKKKGKRATYGVACNGKGG